MPSESGATYEFGEVVLVPFPFTNQTAVKQRPAIIVSGAEYNRLRPDLLMMPITSQLRTAGTFGEVWIAEWASAHLLKPSAIKPHVATIEQTLVIKRLGHLHPADILSLRTVLGNIFG